MQQVETFKIPNLPFLSNTLEKSATRQLDDFLTRQQEPIGCVSRVIPAEAALLQVINDRKSVFVLLYSSAAFAT